MRNSPAIFYPGQSTFSKKEHRVGQVQDRARTFFIAVKA